jgi:two-component system sensor histidine kinase/response regulator
MSMMEAVILIIDDKQANVYTLEKLLEQKGRTFLSAANGKEGLKLALDNDIDLIILDVQMPEMDGFEVAQILKSHRKTKEIPIIFASAEKKEKNSVMKGFEEGAIDYLTKPLDPEITKAKVAVLLKLQQQKKELVEKNLSLEKAELQIKQLNTHLQTSLHQMETLNKELESFAFSVSHDLRAPLRSVIGYTKILEEDYSTHLDDHAKRVLNTLIQNANKMNNLIDDLLEFSRLGRKEIRKTEIDSESLVKQLMNEMSVSEPHRADIKIETLAPAFGDYSLLNQVWTNLLSNAIKYSAKKEHPVIVIGSQRKSDETTYYVKDNGAGFDMAYVEKLFGVFQRLHHQRDFEGTGVGLALVQRIINKHGGKVWAEGKVNEGAAFYFSLPGK